MRLQSFHFCSFGFFFFFACGHGSNSICKQFHVFLGLSHSKHLFDGRDAVFDFFPTIHWRVRMPLFHGLLGNGRCGGSIQDQWPQRLGKHEQLIDGQSALITQLVARFRNLRRNRRSCDRYLPPENRFSSNSLRRPFARFCNACK